MERKLVIFDVDGTIICDLGQAAFDTARHLRGVFSGTQFIPQSTVDAVRAIRKNGNYAVYYTGRPYTHVEKIVNEIGFDGCICTMGAYIKIGREVIQDKKPSPFLAHRIVELVRAAGLDAAFESNQGIQFDKMRPLPAFLQGLKKHFTDRGFDTDKDIDDPDFAFDKLCVWTNEKSNLEFFEKEAEKYLDMVGKKQNMEEWAAKGVSIPACIQRVKDYFQVSTENCYAIGDSVNDLPMLGCAAHSAAMGEAPEEMKRQVEFVTKGILEDGLAYAMEHYRLL